MRLSEGNMCPSSGAQVIPCLCGGPAGHAGPSPAGSQPVSHPEQAGLRPQHRWGHVETEGHAVVAPCGEKNPLAQRVRLVFLWFFFRNESKHFPMWSVKSATGNRQLPPAFALPGMAKSHSGTSRSATGRRDIQSVFGPSWSRSSSSMFFKVVTASLLASLPHSHFRV